MSRDIFSDSTFHTTLFITLHWVKSNFHVTTLVFSMNMDNIENILLLKKKIKWHVLNKLSPQKN